MFRKELGGSSPPLVACFSHNQDKELDNAVNNFENFLFLKKNLSESTIKDYLRHLNTLEQTLKKPASNMNERDVERFMLYIKQTKSPKTYNNYLCMLKAYFRDFLKKDFVNDYKHPNTQVQPKILPSKEEIKTYFDALPTLKYKIIFLALASSGLGVSELLTADIDRNNHMLIPKGHEDINKRSWISFYNVEAAKLMEQFKGNPFESSRNTVAHTFAEIADKTGIKISAQTLRSVFAREMSLRGVPDRYVDAFCGRVPQSVLARHYTEYSPEILRKIYDKAGLLILK